MIFKTLSNPNRLKIVRLLSKGESLTVSNISENIKISIQSTSNHLVMMEKLGVLKSEGRDGGVFYEINTRMHKDFRQAIKLAL